MSGKILVKLFRRASATLQQVEDPAESKVEIPQGVSPGRTPRRVKVGNGRIAGSEIFIEEVCDLGKGVPGQGFYL